MTFSLHNSSHTKFRLFSLPHSLRDYDYYGAYDITKHLDYGYKSLLEEDYTFDFPQCHDVVS